MNYLKKTIIVTLLLITSNLLASVQDLTKIFETNFDKHYSYGRCGDNIMRLLAAARKEGIALYSAQIVEIENGGFSVFGMVNAEWVRESGKLNPLREDGGRRNLPGERNWYHHVVLEMDGYIFDYDFGNEPMILTKQEYFSKMFLDEVREGYGTFYVGAEEKKKTYKITLRNAIETLNAREQRTKLPEAPSIWLKDWLNTL